MCKLKIILTIPMLLLLCFTFVINYGFYTSIGIDNDIKTKSGIVEKYYRLRFSGDGSLWVGGGYFHIRNGYHQYKKIDLAGEFFSKPRRYPPKSVWNYLGFWRETKENKNHGTAEYWIAMPSWLILLILILIFKVRSP